MPQVPSVNLFFRRLLLAGHVTELRAAFVGSATCKLPELYELLQEVVVDGPSPLQRVSATLRESVVASLRTLQ